MTRTSKALSLDTKAVLHQDCICRIALHYERFTTRSYPATYYTSSYQHRTGYFCSVRHLPPVPVLAKVRNVELRISFSEPIPNGRSSTRSENFTEIVARIVAAMDKRRNCYIKITLASHVELQMEPAIKNVMLLFKDFESVTVELRKQSLYSRFFER